MRERVALMLKRNGIEQPSSMHHRCGMFLDKMEKHIHIQFQEGNGMQLRVSQLGKDIKLARSFRKLWEACHMIETYLRGDKPEEDVFSGGLYSDSRL
jgi:hypothetical protein